MLSDMEISDTFLADIRVPSVTSLRSIDYVLRQTALFHTEDEHDRCMQLLTSAGLGEDGRLNIGIKKVRAEVQSRAYPVLYTDVFFTTFPHSSCPRLKWQG